jgi:hypothetical protein
MTAVTLMSDFLDADTCTKEGALSHRVSFVKALSGSMCRLAGVTVLSAVSVRRCNIWSEAHAL